MTSKLNQTTTVMQVAFGLMATLAGLDKFTNLLTPWEQYVAPVAASLLPVTPALFMKVVGVIEIVAGALVLGVRPALGAAIVAAWLTLVAGNLVLAGFYDIAVRDLVLAVSALTLSHLLALRRQPAAV